MIKIAIVEDEAMYAKQLEEFLHQYEAENHETFDITIYSDGDQIVNKYKSQFDIILMDVEMKFMDGMPVSIFDCNICFRCQQHQLSHGKYTIFREVFI